jgi:hypothetical protein
MNHRLAAVLLLAVAGGCAPAVVPAPAPTPEPTPRLEPAFERPIPYPVPLPAAFRAAVERGTRTMDGRPGPQYWQQHAHYRIQAALDVDARRIDGTVQIRYENRSPDTLGVLVLQLAQNVHAEGVIRNEPQEVTGGKRITRVRSAGRELRESELPLRQPGWGVRGTIMAVALPAPLLPGTQTTLDVDWSFDVPQQGAGGRMGWDGDDVFFLAYWYPQMAVYDDLGGWHDDAFRGLGEFYMGFADYDVTLVVPEGWVVRATGELQNAAEVFPPEVRQRLARAAESDSTTVILAPEHFGPGNATMQGQDGTLEWRFTAENVRDFSFSATLRSRWDGARAEVAGQAAEGGQRYARIETLWRESAPRWANVTRYQQHSLRFLSGFTDFPYPWPHMTAVEGADIIGGGMEFPMLTLMGSYEGAGPGALYDVTAHELAHMWIPMIVGTDERRHGWLDEGATSFAEAQARNDFRPGEDADRENRDQYLQIARADREGEIMRRTDFHYDGAAFFSATYAKPAAVLATLRGLIGEERFLAGYRSFIRDWAFRHASPWDLFHAFEAAAGVDLEWFWRTWYFETWTLDQAVHDVAPAEDGSATIVIRDLGLAPMPARVTVTREDGSTIRLEVPVQRWLAGHRSAELEVPQGSPVVRVEIDPEAAFPDIDRANNVWTR